MGILSVNLTLPGLKAADSRQILPEGGLLSFRVLGKGTDGSYTLSFLGKRVLARSTVPLPLGGILQARVIRGKGTPRLELLKIPPPLESLLQKIGLKGRVGAEEVVRGLMQSGAALNPGVIRRILAHTSKEPKNRRLFARLAGILDRKGVDLSQPGWEAVIEAYLSGDFGRGEGEGGRRGGEKHRQGEEGIPNARAIKKMWAPGDIPIPLHLYNHIKGTEENWLFLPIFSRFKGRELSGSVEVQLAENGKMMEALIRVRDGGEDRLFRLGPPGRGGRRLLQWASPKGREKVRVGGLGDFSEKLRNLGIDLDDTVRDESEGGDLPPGGVDWTV